MKHIYHLSILLMISVNCFAYYPTVRNHSKKSYNAGAQNWCITQTDGGSMVFANTGILEYDGNEWRRTMTGNHTTVRSLLYESEKDRIYFGATNEFGYMGIDSEGKAEYVSLIDSLGYPLEEVCAIHKSEDALWLRENKKLYKYDFQGVKQYSFTNKITYSTQIDEDIIIFVSNAGAFKATKNGEFTAISGTEVIADKKICSILPYRDNDLLFISSSSGTFRLHNGELLPFPLDFEDALNKATVFCAETDGTFLAFGTVSDGVFLKNLEDGSSIHLNTFSGLQNNTVLSMFFDHRGNLWLGLDKGIDMVELASPEYRMFGNPDMFGAGYASAIYDGKMWLGTNQGLYCIEYPLPTGIVDDNDFISTDNIKGQVWSLLTYDDRLFCCHDTGLYIICGNSTGHIPLNGVWKMEPLHEYPDLLLGSTYDRLFLLRKTHKGWIFDSWLEGFEDASKAFEEDEDGYIWFSHWIKGLFRLKLDIENKKISEVRFCSRSDNFPEDWGNTPIDLNGKIYFSTTRGYYGFDKYSGKAYPYSMMNNLFTEPPAEANAYMTPYGQGFFSSGELQALYYKDRDGNDILDTLSLRDLSSRRLKGFDDIRSLSANEIMLNTEEGFSIIRTDRLADKKDTLETAVYIKEIYTSSNGKDSLTYFSRGRTPEDFCLHLPYRHNTLKFKAIYPSYTSGSDIRYSFMLENYDDGWSDYSESGSKEYTKLPHGHYILRVRAEDGLTDTGSECAIKVDISAPWYRSRLAGFIYCMLVILSIVLMHKVIQVVSIRRAKQMAQKQKEEMRQEQMKRELEHKAQDLAASTMNVIRKNEILLDIDTELEKVAEHMAEDRNRSLKILGKIRYAIRENIRHDDDWQKFEKNFDIVYDDFLQRLGKAFPQLTVSDKKMCAYLKMDLSSKDIAPLLNITVRSVEMTRYRLRKKLGLSHEDNLTEFLHKF